MDIKNKVEINPWELFGNFNYIRPLNGIDCDEKTDEYYQFDKYYLINKEDAYRLCMETDEVIYEVCKKIDYYIWAKRKKENFYAI